MKRNNKTEWKEISNQNEKKYCGNKTKLCLCLFSPLNLRGEACEIGTGWNSFLWYLSKLSNLLNELRKIPRTVYFRLMTFWSNKGHDIISILLQTMQTHPIFDKQIDSSLMFNISVNTRKVHSSWKSAAVSPKYQMLAIWI